MARWGQGAAPFRSTRVLRWLAAERMSAKSMFGFMMIVTAVLVACPLLCLFVNVVFVGDLIEATLFAHQERLWGNLFRDLAFKK